ncbi:hypothetical protein N0V93_005378 [Gnomoniopsis smithogilvyi]|uniref:FAD dependent oxidoreductase domain-containing protein n=1 Tax=Gnomoniopsis smithogilvyi TaxID=1191159 RepID=A0A9W9CX30_9PEZI|nr:hypothetical protein N0V93_005378 [Gnomoniopsis smithogilvyi]
MGSEFQHQPRVLVIGAGVIGASIAWHLTKHADGANVTIVAEEMGGIATPCSFAWLNASRNNPRFYYDFRRRSMAGWKRMASEVPELGQLVQWCGSLGWDLPPEKLAEYQRNHAAWGYDIRRIERAEILQVEPGLTPENDFVPEWALRVGEEGMVEPAQAARLLAADAQRRGARLVTGNVTRLLQEGDGRVTGLVLATGEELRADHVVLAAGVGSVSLCASVGVTLPLKTPAPAGLLVRSKPVQTRILNHVVYTTRGHMRQTADGYILAGSDFIGGDPGPNPEATARQQLEQVKSNLKPAYGEQLEFDCFTIGYRPQPVDGLPVLGASGLKGLDIAVMHSGVTNAALVGELLAEKVLTGKEDASLKDFSLQRFTNTHV